MKKQLLILIVLFAITTLYRVEAQTIKLWGFNYSGGANNAGNIFECSVTGTIIDTCDMNANGNDADEPEGTPVKAYNGLLYGMTYKGGADGDGAIFSYDPLTNKETTLHSFGSGNDGESPYNSSLLEVDNTLLYGLTQYGGGDEEGVIFSYDITTNSEAVLHEFGSGYDGAYPTGSLIQATNGLLYGMTYSGGDYEQGTIFSYNISTGKDSVVHSFGNGTDGSYIYGNLTQVSDSVLYGMTYSGGADDGGTIFSFNILTGDETVKYNFGAGGGDDARLPYGSLIVGKNGVLYGMTYGGGDDEGTIFSFDMNKDTEQVLHIFGNNYDGSYPYGDLMAAGNVLLYGLTEDGGLYGGGVIFSFDTAGSTETVLYNFSDSSGDEPYGGLLEDDTTTGVKRLTVESGQLTVYPNPSSDFIYVNLSQQQNQPVLLSLYNMLGQQVYNALAPLHPNSTITVPVTGLPDGVYVLKVGEGEVSQQKEVVVAK